MPVREIVAKTLLRKSKHLDSWFLSGAGMNLYRGCAHNCAYCDGRAERYGVDGEFETDIVVKINAPELLERELNPKGKRKPFPNGFVLVGGGVGDSWQPLEEKYQLARRVLSILHNRGLPVHVLTKSALVMRDLDILKDIDKHRRTVVSVSFSSVDKEISKTLEPAASSPVDRLGILTACKSEGIACGAFLMPVVPGISDMESEIFRSVEAFAEAGADFVIFSGMTLKPGRQEQHFYRAVLEDRPTLISGYRKIYPGNPYGNAISGYYDKIHRRFLSAVKRTGLPMRMPERLFADLLLPAELADIRDAHERYIVQLEKLIATI